MANRTWRTRQPIGYCEPTSSSARIEDAMGKLPMVSDAPTRAEIARAFGEPCWSGARAILLREAAPNRIVVDSTGDSFTFDDNRLRSWLVQSRCWATEKAGDDDGQALYWIGQRDAYEAALDLLVNYLVPTTPESRFPKPPVVDETVKAPDELGRSA